MVTLIHNVLNTDYVMLVHDDDCVAGRELLQNRLPVVEKLSGLPAGSLAGLGGLFGVSGICNALGAISIARYLDLSPDDNVVTIATDGFDRYPSMLDDLAARAGEINSARAKNWYESIGR